MKIRLQRRQLYARMYQSKMTPPAYVTYESHWDGKPCPRIWIDLFFFKIFIRL